MIIYCLYFSPYLKEYTGTLLLIIFPNRKNVISLVLIEVDHL